MIHTKAIEIAAKIQFSHFISLFKKFDYLCSVFNEQ